ncbi:SRPBCC domain-containing protein [Luteococcus peritonei]|uniref:SRPBCC domain-containing protein n=1 Tax=Luteococcus peritonei TaxID=88874 RepID=A0ABW4RV65_9ACTN
MTANMIVVVEREFPYDREDVFDAWTAPEQMSQWRGSPGWHVDTETVTSDLRAGGRHHHDKVRESDGLVVSTDAVFTEFFRPDVFVAQQRISGDEAIDAGAQMELRVEFTKLGRGTLVRIIQGPYDPEIATEHATGWEAELDRLETWLQAHGRRIEQKGARR